MTLKVLGFRAVIYFILNYVSLSSFLNSKCEMALENKIAKIFLALSATATKYADDSNVGADNIVRAPQMRVKDFSRRAKSASANLASEKLFIFRQRRQPRKPTA